MARYFRSRSNGCLFVSAQDDLVWHRTLPDGRPSRACCVHMLARGTPAWGHPEQECFLIAVFEAMFQACLEEVPFEEASRADRGLVGQAARSFVLVALKMLRDLLPSGARLHLVDCGWTEAGQHFDVYLKRTPHARLRYLNPLLVEAQLFPTAVLDGVLRILVPFAGKEVHGARLLSQALAARLLGASMEALPYPFDLTY